ncbi:MAG TPA: glycosyltransferase family 39 protein [Candidatus Acidoferrales bacterium]|nr:glycosyltransferase family 39 protein [Candidatus Acidoferrales bacterium]
MLAQGISAPFQKDAEPQSAEWIQSIVRDGHWLIPHDAYGFIDRKPPLFYWLSAAASEISGGTVDEIRARVVSLFAGTALAVAILAWTAANVGVVEGWLAFLFILGTSGFASRATEALTDMLLTLMLFGAFSMMRPQLDGAGSLRRVVAIGVALGLGVLTKGPVAIVLCALAAAIYLALERRSPLEVLRKRWPWQVLAIALAIGAVWYVPALVVGGERIVRLIFTENFGHFMPAKLGGTGESHRPFYFIFARLLGGAFPMTLLIVPALLAFWTAELAPAKRDAVVYQLSLMLAVLLFFSIASVKRDDYILPALPGIAILCASVFNLDEIAGKRGAAAILRDVVVIGLLVAPFFTALYLATVGAGPDAPHPALQSSDSAFVSVLHRDLLNPVLSVIALLGGLFIASGVGIFGLFRRSATTLGVAFGLAGLCGSVLWTAVLRPTVAQMRSLKSFVPTVASTVKDSQLCIPAGINYELSYYYGSAVPHLKDPRCSDPKPGETVYLLATPREFDALKPEMRARLKLVAKSDLIGGGGPPSLYEIRPSDAPPDLKGNAAGAR